MAVIDFERLNRIAEERDGEFQRGKPFPCMYIDDFLPVETAEKVLAEFPESDAEWNHYHHYNEKKLAITDIEKMGPTAQELYRALMTDEFTKFMTKLTGIEGLITDPELDGAGLHMIRNGGFLNLHTDFLAHTKQTHWSRQISFLIFFNKGCTEDWNANLELWNDERSECVTSILPKFNRCAMFQCLKPSYHGHPTPLTAPDGRCRKSMAFYMFRDEGHALKLTPTDYRGRPEDSKTKRALIAADRGLLRAYSFVKRHTKMRDGFVDRFLKRF